MGSIAWSQTLAEQNVREIVSRAFRSARPQPYASLLMEADAEAVKLERRRPYSDSDTRCVRIPNFGCLHYTWNEIQRSENYQHDLARSLVREFRGTPAGADALVALLRLGPYGGDWFDEEEFLPDEFTELQLHRRIIGIIDSPGWRNLKDVRLMRIEAEAYETWWSLSRAKPDDPGLTQNNVSAADYSEGAETARRTAIELYRLVLAAGDDPALRRRVAEIERGQDTNQRAWFRVGD